jgi:hypothetical protein
LCHAALVILVTDEDPELFNSHGEGTKNDHSQ